MIAKLGRLGPVVLLTFLGLTSLACTRVKVKDAQGPNGGPWKEITCSRMNEKCFKEAEKICPNGYVFARTDKAAPTPPASEANKVTTLPPQKEWHDDMYSKKPGKMLVQCASSPPKIQAAVSER